MVTGRADARCTVSTRIATCSGGVAGTMPWPRLKMNPGAGPASSSTPRAAAATAAGRGRSAQRRAVAAAPPAPRRGGHRGRVGQQRDWVDVPLERDAIAKAPAGFADVDRPIEAD